MTLLSMSLFALTFDNCYLFVPENSSLVKAPENTP